LGELQIVGLNKIYAAISISEEGTWDLSGVAEKDKILSEEEHR
jgi:hypothetical protein